MIPDLTPVAIAEPVLAPEIIVLSNDEVRDTLESMDVKECVRDYVAKNQGKEIECRAGGVMFRLSVTARVVKVVRRGRK